MTLRWILPVFLVLLILAIPVSARTITAEGVSSYAMKADDGYVIYQITVNDLPMGTNQTHTFTTEGGSFLLTIGTYKEWGYNNADISLIFPNGTVQTTHVSALGVLIGHYKTSIQYVFPQPYSGVDITTISLVLGLTPVTASFNSGVMGWDPSTSLAFTAVSGNLGGTTTVYVEEMTAADFLKNVVNYNPIYGIGNLGSQIFQWSWNAVLGFISMIPVIGPIMVSLIGVMGGVIGQGYFWLIFIIRNFPAVLCGVETLILMMAVINAGKGDKAMGRMAKNFYSYNLVFVLGLIGLVNIVWGWTRSAVEIVSAVVSALKPT